MTCFGAENETRTRDPNLGKVVLYQLSYFRKFPEWDCKGRHFFFTSKFFQEILSKKIKILLFPSSVSCLCIIFATFINCEIY